MEPTPEIIEEIITETPIPKAKKERTPAQLENLAKAREKAAVVRAQNTEIRRKQAEIDKALALEVKKQKLDRVEKEYAVIHGETSKTEKEEEEEEEIEYVKKPKKVPKKKCVIVVEESSSEEEVEVRLPKRKREVRQPSSPPDPKTERYKMLYNKMFGL